MLRLARLSLVAIVLGCSLSAGCGGPPPLHPIEGKVTLGGKPFYRLIVYFRPANGEVTEYTMGIGETDKEGKLILRSAGGHGLKAGDYKVTFSAIMTKAGKSVGSDEKPDDAGQVQTFELVKPPYDDKTSQDKTPVKFTVKAGTNTFDFDVPQS